VNIDTNVIVKFSEAMDKATVNGDTVELRDASSALVPATVSYDEGTFTATLDPTASLSAGVTYTALVRGGGADPRVKDVAGNALAADKTWTFTTKPAPPQVISTTPGSAAFDIPTSVAPRATFSKLLLFSTLTEDSTVLLQDAMGHLVPITISYTFSASPSIVAIVPQNLLQPSQTYTVTLKGGPNEPHILDLQGIPLPEDYTWSFTTAAAPPPIPASTIFANTTPANPTVNDDGPIEVGMRFRTDVNGLITGVRFYKGDATNGGEHVGHLWTNNGTSLGSVTFNSETESGWQQAFFQTPIPITANTTYVVSYFAPQGHYAGDLDFFAQEFPSPPLRALRDGFDGANGVFLDDMTGFPTATFRSLNYYVDVVFSDPTQAPPQVLSTIPAPGSLIFLNEPDETVTFSATFSEPIDTTSVNTETVLLTDTANNPVPFTISFGEGNFTVTLTPLQPLLVPAAYTVTLKGGADAPHITDVTGNPLAADFTWSITTDAVGDPALTKVTMLSDWVTAGANFIGMRPDKLLAQLLGISDESSVRSEAYLQVDTTLEPGAGIVNQTIQFANPPERSLIRRRRFRLRESG
jgi:hypothetical protein